jgi:sigma-54 specific flagellar transcriptional regulator A
LFLDEIGDMSLPMQVKLLRVLQERQFERVGNHATLQCNVRIIAATHRNLEAAIASGQFRSDLYYRINVFPIDVPPLRQRLEDLGALIEDFVRQNCAAGRAELQFSAAARSALEKYSWPGNIRELGNLIERLSITHAGSEIDVADLPPRYRPVEPDTVAAPSATELPMEDDSQLIAQVVLGPPAMLAQPPLLPNEGFDLRAHIDSLEREFISQALQRSGGVVAHAARLLGLRRTTLVEKLRKLDGGNALPPEV